MGFKFNPLFGTGLTPTGSGTAGAGILADGSVPFTGDQSMGGNQLTNVGAPDSDDDATNKEYVDDAIATGVATAANRTLSNLTSPTAINQNLLPDTTSLYDLGSPAKKWKNVFTNVQVSSPLFSIVEINNGNSVGNLKEDDATVDAEIALVHTDNSTNSHTYGIAVATSTKTSTIDSRSILIRSGHTADGDSGDLDIYSGNATGSGDSGNLLLKTGTSTGTRGEIRFVDGSEGTAGEVWTSTDTLGSGAWITPTAGANQTLSNLTSPTAINEDLIFDTGAAANIKTQDEAATTQGLQLSSGNASGVGNASGPVSISSGGADVNEDTGTLGFGTADATGTGVSGPVFVTTGETEDGNSGIMDHSTGGSVTASSGNQTIQTGAAGSNSGNISLITGTAGATRGNIILDAEQITALANIIPNATATYDLGSSSLKWSSLYTSTQVTSPQHVITRGSTDIGYLREDDSTLDAEIALIHITNSAAPHTHGVAVGTDDKDGATNSRSVLIASGDTEDGDSGTVNIKSGVASGTGDSGNILISTGTAGGTQGEIRLVDGSEGTAGHVWTSTDTTGGGAWASASSSDILTFLSTAVGAGSADAAVTVTGLLATDTILAITQQVRGATTAAFIGWTSVVDDGFTGHWSADPGGTAQLLVTVKR